jgi:hypothetical protein
MGIWNFVHPLHLRNTAIAQHEIDREFIDYHNQEWNEKLKAADLKMVRIMAREKPDLFVRNFVLGRDKNSRERKLMAGVLQRHNPEYYQLNQEVLGEAIFQDEDEDDRIESSEALND